MRNVKDPISWGGNLDDDCIAYWAQLVLRAESMGADQWWWAVIDDKNDGLEIASSNKNDQICRDGVAARAAAEKAARKYLEWNKL